MTRGRVVKKGTSGTAVKYITRNRALKKLQITPRDFSHLCILKGIYPREPKHKNKVPGGGKAFATIYHVKDIQHLLHEPILSKLREYKTYTKKMNRLLGRGEWSSAKKFEQNKPTYLLDHIIKERYPTFSDALNDLDDVLSHICLFSILPKIPMSSRYFYTNDLIQKCIQLRNEFLHYIMHTHSLRKSFISIKGMYFQAEIHGHQITWLMPFEFHHNIPDSVDMDTMFTFLELYHQLLKFVNYKLYNDADLIYPPSINHKLESSGVGLMAMVPLLKIDEIDHANNIQDTTVDDDDITKTLFSKCIFYLSREVPKDPLILIIRSFGGKVGWAHSPGSPYHENDERITHHIIDRPVQEQIYLNRVYIQPQWIFDCSNQSKLLKTELYGLGVELPPHLSPFEISNTNEIISTLEEELLDVDNYTEQQELAMSMMSKKKRKLYEAMQHGLRRQKKHQ